MTRKLVAWVTSGLGFGLVVAGLALVYPPAALVAAGLTLAAVGLVAIDVEPPK